MDIRQFGYNDQVSLLSAQRSTSLLDNPLSAAMPRASLVLFPSVTSGLKHLNYVFVHDVK